MDHQVATTSAQPQPQTFGLGPSTSTSISISPGPSQASLTPTLVPPSTTPKPPPLPPPNFAASLTRGSTEYALGKPSAKFEAEMTMYGAPRPLKYNSDPVTRIAEQTCMGADPHRWAAPQVAAQVCSPPLPPTPLGLSQAAQAATTCTCTMHNVMHCV